MRYMRAKVLFSFEVVFIFSPEPNIVCLSAIHAQLTRRIAAPAILGMDGTGNTGQCVIRRVEERNMDPIIAITLPLLPLFRSN